MKMRFPQPRQWTEEEIATVRRLAEAGESRQQIARVVGYTPRRVYDLMVQNLGMGPFPTYTDREIERTPPPDWPGVRFEDASRQDLRADIARRQMAFFRMPDGARLALKRFIVPWTLP